MRGTIGIAALLFVLCVLLAISGALHPFGRPTEVQRMTDQYFIDNGMDETGGANIVCDVVFDYRGYDTLGEATVLFTAVMGCAAILRGMKHGEE
ncbi:MAG: hypothetical protein KKI07_02115 [Euryarchaeota archaeon]|nr:hypothetical protein [Euryarchaeota archaeon]